MLEYNEGQRMCCGKAHTKNFTRSLPETAEFSSQCRAPPHHLPPPPTTSTATKHTHAHKKAASPPHSVSWSHCLSLICVVFMIIGLSSDEACVRGVGVGGVGDRWSSAARVICNSWWMSNSNKINKCTAFDPAGFSQALGCLVCQGGVGNTATGPQLISSSLQFVA